MRALQRALLLVVLTSWESSFAAAQAPAKAAAPGTVRSSKTGATARVSPKYAAQFQAYINALEAYGATIYYMGGYRSGKCSPASLHPCGMALDVCQDSRGRVSGRKDCSLPSPSTMARIAKEHGLFEGSLWCNSDYGHAQITATAKPCATRPYAAAAAPRGGTGKIKTVTRQTASQY